VELRTLIRRMSIEHPLWGAPRIHGEPLNLGFEVARLLGEHKLFCGNSLERSSFATVMHEEKASMPEKMSGNGMEASVCPAGKLGAAFGRTQPFNFALDRVNRLAD
jgi:hypothetical protein